MIAAEVRRWSAWSPGCEDENAWQRWCRTPRPLALEGQPEARFLPPMLRRRCGPLARAMLTTAYGCCSEEELPRVASVFGSRHGNINESIELLERLAQGQALSPTRFSHSVHNAQAGLFSIAAGNREASSSIAACEATFPSAWLEALTLLERVPTRPVLLVVGDVPLAATFADLVDEPEGVYSLALLLVATAPERGLSFSVGPAEPEDRPAWPDALVFLRWLLSDAPRLSLQSGRNRWTWQRPASV